MRFPLILFGLFALPACDSDSSGSGPQTFKNIYLVNEQACRDRGLSPTRFAIEYPDNLEIEYPENERNHISIKLRTGELVLEELWIAETELRRPDRAEAPAWIETFVKNYNLQSQGLKVAFMGEDNFNGVNTIQIKGDVDFMSFNNSQYNGLYKMMLILPMPESNDSLTAVSITMIAHEYSEIKSLEDFESKGIISKIVKTFRYIE